MPSETQYPHKEFADFFRHPTRESLEILLQNNFGETNQLDFKLAWIQFPAISRHVLAIANSGGGCIVLGIDQKADNSLEAIGLTENKDKAVVTNGLKKFLPTQLKYDILDFSFPANADEGLGGKNFQVVMVFDAPEYLPFVAEAESIGIRQNAIYVRRGTSSEEATYEELQGLLNRRIQTGTSTQSEFDLQQEFQELAFLYGQIERYHYGPSRVEKQIMEAVGHMAYHKPKTQNPAYPKEDYEDFVVRMIELKKSRIENIIKGNI